MIVGDGAVHGLDVLMNDVIDFPNVGAVTGALHLHKIRHN